VAVLPEGEALWATEDFDAMPKISMLSFVTHATKNTTKDVETLA
jgi:hypothetical protein